ncbi:MAG: hypothetical protein ACE14L_00135 [Terriglobales bacterium]
MKNINWKTGFNRVFVVAAIVWALFIIWYLPSREWNDRIDVAVANLSTCVTQSARNPAAHEQCIQQHQKALDEMPRTAWHLAWNNLPTLLVLAIVPPVVCYFLLRGAALVVRWVWRGFVSGESHVR